MNKGIRLLLKQKVKSTPETRAAMKAETIIYKDKDGVFHCKPYLPSKAEVACSQQKQT